MLLWFHYLAAILITLVFGAGTVYAWRIYNALNNAGDDEEEGKSKKKFLKEKTSIAALNQLSWLNGNSYVVLAAIIDAVIPAYTLAECSDQNILKTLHSLHPQLPDCEHIILNVKDISKYRTYLCAGALQYGNHKQIAELLERFSTTLEKRKLNMLLQLLSTSLGGFFLTGYPIPFQVRECYTSRETSNI